MILVDTSGWVGMFNARDQYHRDSTLIWKRLSASKEELITTTLIFSETVTFLARRVSYVYAVEIGGKMLNSPHLSIIPHERADDATSLRIMHKWADQSVGYADCVSFALMRRLGVQKAFSFDRHFALAGFELLQA